VATVNCVVVMMTLDWSKSHKLCNISANNFTEVRTMQTGNCAIIKQQI